MDFLSKLLHKIIQFTILQMRTKTAQGKSTICPKSEVTSGWGKMSFSRDVTAVNSHCYQSLVWKGADNLFNAVVPWSCFVLIFSYLRLHFMILKDENYLIFIVEPVEIRKCLMHRIFWYTATRQPNNNKYFSTNSIFRKPFTRPPKLI